MNLRTLLEAIRMHPDSPAFCAVIAAIGVLGFIAMAAGGAQ